jgi:lipoprotein-anchoring transpeptidase ErfK/SrfK
VQESPQRPFGSASFTRYASGKWSNVARRAERRRCGAPSFARGRPAWRVLAAAAAALCLSLIVGACAGSAGQRTSASQSPLAPVARLTITPPGGSRSAQPQKGITVKVSDGKIVNVTVETRGAPVTGRLDPAATKWRSRWALDTATGYTVHATARDTAGKTVTATSTFRTLKPRHTFATQIFEGLDLTYGVGMPIILKFSRPISDRRAVERSLRLWSSKRVVGTWYWDGSSTLYFRTRNYWPAHTKVRFVAHLSGVEGAPGVYGTHTLKQSFVIGRSLIAVASTSAHHVRIYLDRRVFADWPISTGKPGDDTPNGTYLTIEKQNPAHMKGPGYDIQVPWSVRFTWSGDYLHDAFWSVGQQGFANVSHGCVNLSPEHAKTYYQLAVPGDPVTIGGSPRGGTWGNGWTVWFLSWRKLLRGSALHKAVRVSPDGSTLVDPGSLSPSKAKPPLNGPKPGNATAG